MYKIALLGAGRIGRIHAANVLAEPRLELAYVVDPIAESAAAIASLSGAMVTTVEQALADQEIVGVIVASSTDTHLDYSIRAAQAGKAVFCEKPLDLDLDRAQSAQAVLAGGSVRLLLGFNRRFDPHFARLQAKVASNALGALETVHIISHDPSPPPIDYVKASGGLFKDMAIHDFDIARWLLGEEPTEVFAAASCLIDPAIGEAGDIDTAKTMLRTPSGKLCMISNSRRSGYGYDQRIEAYCAEGLIRADNVLASTVQTWSAQGPASDLFQNFFLDRYADAYRREMSHFADVLAGAATPLATYEDGIQALALATAAAKSARSGAVEQVMPPA
jgi:myo-inositol 2-dehydrogenase / D-chiro-inositol 1-dehydrogenase